MSSTVALVSIVMPVFNRFELAERAIKSILNQTYQNWELIIVDDKSIIPFKLNSIKDGRIKVIHNAVNVGPGTSRQNGVNLTKGEYLAFLDSDDFWTNKFLEESITIHLSKPHITFSYCISKYTDDHSITQKSDREFSEIFPTLILYGRPWPTCALLWKRKYASNWVNSRNWEDYQMEFDSSLINNQIAHLNQVLCFVDRTNEGKISQIYDSIEVIRNTSRCLKHFQNKMVNCIWDKKKMPEDIVNKKLNQLLFKFSLKALCHNEYTTAKENIYEFDYTTKLIFLISKFLNIITKNNYLILRLYCKIRIRSLNKITKNYPIL